MSHNVAPLFFIFALYFAIITFVIARGFYIGAGKAMKRKTGTDGQSYFFSKRKYGRYGMKYTVSAGVPVQNGFTFSVCRKTFWHCLLTSLGLAQDLKTGDPLLKTLFISWPMMKKG